MSVLFFTAVKLDSRWVNTALNPASAGSASGGGREPGPGIPCYDWIVRILFD